MAPADVGLAGGLRIGLGLAGDEMRAGGEAFGRVHRPETDQHQRILAVQPLAFRKGRADAVLLLRHHSAHAEIQRRGGAVQLGGEVLAQDLAAEIDAQPVIVFRDDRIHGIKGRPSDAEDPMEVIQRPKRVAVRVAIAFPRQHPGHDAIVADMFMPDLKPGGLQQMRGKTGPATRMADADDEVAAAMKTGQSGAPLMAVTCAREGHPARYNGAGGVGAIPAIRLDFTQKSQPGLAAIGRVG